MSITNLVRKEMIKLAAWAHAVDTDRQITMAAARAFAYIHPEEKKHMIVRDQGPLYPRRDVWMADYFLAHLPKEILEEGYKLSREKAESRING